MRILVVDREPPLSLTQGNSLIGRHLFERLAARHQLAIVCPVDPAAADESRRALSDVFDEVRLVPRTGGAVPALRGWLEAELAVRAPTVAPGAARQLAGAVASLVAAWPADVLHVRQLPMAPFRRFAPGMPSALELVDSERLGSERAVRQIVAAGRWRAATIRAVVRAGAARLAEAAAVRGYDAVTAVAAADAAAIRSVAPRGTAVELIPNGVDADVFRPVERAEEPRTLAFVGAMSFSPNVAAARYLVEQVLPRVTTPDVRVRLVGRSPTPEILQLAARPGVEVTGEVDDVRPELAAATLVVCAMVSGSGIKNKVLEAMAMGRPIVATPLAVEGIDLGRSADPPIAIAASASGLAAAIDRLLADEGARRAMAARAREIVMKRYTWDACAATYEALYERLGALGTESVRVKPSARPTG
ncbi:MAG TPA: glycosyltransferase [Candidatus Limnocylindrales bacterium]|nr:glycosyltransferase [Candidatus Limnocylindrales bacterium]